MGQFATVLVPVALQAANSAWGQYQQQALYAQQQQERTLANQAAADTARRQAELTAHQTLDSAALENRAAWDAHDLWAGQQQRDADADIAGLNRDYGLAQHDLAEALRRDSATQRARFAGMGLDVAAGSARAVLAGMEADAAEGTRRALDDLSYQTGRVRDTTSSAIEDDWRSTASAAQNRAYQANLDVWGQQNELDTYLYNLGVRSGADQRRDLLDLTMTNRRAVLGLGGSAAGGLHGNLWG